MSEWRNGGKIVFASAIGVGVGLTGIPFYTLGIFAKPVCDAFGWSRASVSGAGLCIGLGGALMAPFIGRLADRVGARVIALVSLFGLALGFLGVASIGPSLVAYYGAWIFLALAGAGTSPIVWTRAVNSWFDRSKGLALGITLMGTGIAAIFAPILVANFIVQHGWRAGYLAISAVVAFVAIPVTFLLFRERPLGTIRTLSDEGGRQKINALVRHALRSGQFWRNGVGFFFISIALASVIVHLSPIITDRGLAPLTAAKITGLLGIMVVVGRVAMGLLVDRFHAPLVAMGFFTIAAIGCLVLLGAGTSIWKINLAVMLLGLAAGAEVDVLSYLTARYFGLTAYGEIYGAQFAFFAVGGAIGPLLTGRLFDLTGSYQVALISAAVCLMGGGLSVLSLGAYPKPVGVTTDMGNLSIE